MQPGGAKPLVLLQSPTKLTAHDPQTRRNGLDVRSEVGRHLVADRRRRHDLRSRRRRHDRTSRRRRAARIGKTFGKRTNWPPATPAPSSHGDRLYVVNKAGAMTCGDATTGKVLWRQRLKGRFWATPLAIGDSLYCVNHDGLAQVVKAEADSRRDRERDRFRRADLRLARLRRRRTLLPRRQAPLEDRATVSELAFSFSRSSARSSAAFVLPARRASRIGR